MDENTGTTVYDTATAGSTNDNGTITGATWTTSGKLGNALSFSGSSQYVTVNNSSDLNITTNTITLECWAKSGTEHVEQRQSHVPLEEQRLHDGARTAATASRRRSTSAAPGTRRRTRRAV